MLISHPVLAKIGEDLRTCLLKLLVHPQIDPAQVGLTPAESRAHAIYSRVAEIDNCLRSLRIAIGGLQAEAASNSPNIEQYRYHAENYLLRLTGIYDRACRFVGVTIGMTSREIDKQSGNRDVQERLRKIGANNVVHRLCELKALLEPHWENRNVAAHAGEISSQQIELFSAVSQLKLESVNPEKLHKLMVEHFRDGAFDFGVLALQCECLVYSLIEDLACEIASFPKPQ
jgi:hypothetical protein